MRLKLLALVIGATVAGSEIVTHYFSALGQTVLVAQTPNSVVLDDFEGSGLRPLCPELGSPSYATLWNHFGYPAGAAATVSQDTSDAYSGRGSYKVSITPNSAGLGDMYEQFLPMNDGCGAVGNARQFVLPTLTKPFTSGFSQASWQRNRYNRMRFWIKVPKGYPEPFAAFNGAQFTNNVGTYVRSSWADWTGQAEDGGWHFYHMFYVPHTEEWHQVIVDMHPTATRSGAALWDGQFANGNGDLWATCCTPVVPDGRANWTAYPTNQQNGTHGEPAYNYFDALTRFYVAGNVAQGDGPALPSALFPLVFRMDQFEFYYDPNPANVTDVYSLNGVYRPRDNYLYVGWNRNKFKDVTWNSWTMAYDVRYSFTDIFKSGWNAATPAPNGTGVKPPAGLGFNMMRYETTQINVGQHDTLYVAIKPQDTSSFNQIAIPLKKGTPSSSPQPPGNVVVK